MEKVEPVPECALRMKSSEVAHRLKVTVTLAVMLTIFEARHWMEERSTRVRVYDDLWSPFQGLDA